MSLAEQFRFKKARRAPTKHEEFFQCLPVARRTALQESLREYVKERAQQTSDSQEATEGCSLLKVKLDPLGYLLHLATQVQTYAKTDRKTPAVRDFTVKPALRARIQAALGELTPTFLELYEVETGCLQKLEEGLPIIPIQNQGKRQLKEKPRRVYAEGATRATRGTFQGLKIGRLQTSIRLRRLTESGHVVSYRKPYFRIRWSSGSLEELQRSEIEQLLPRLLDPLCSRSTSNQLEKERASTHGDILSVAIDSSLLELFSFHWCHFWAAMLECDPHGISLNWNVDLLSTEHNAYPPDPTIAHGFAFKAAISTPNLSMFLPLNHLRLPVAAIYSSLRRSSRKGTVQHYLVLPAPRRHIYDSAYITSKPLPGKLTIFTVCQLARAKLLPRDVAMRIAACVPECTTEAISLLDSIPFNEGPAHVFVPPPEHLLSSDFGETPLNLF